MKKFILILLICLLGSFITAQKFSLDGGYIFVQDTAIDVVYLKGNILTYSLYNQEIESLLLDKYNFNKNDLTVQFDIIHIYGVPFLKLAKKIPQEFSSGYIYGYDSGIATDDKILFLAGWDKEWNMPFLILDTRNFGSPCSSPIKHGVIYTDCSSYLKEKNKEYTVENLMKDAPGTPWVEGVPGDGIGESFVIKKRNDEVNPYLLIMNGYILYEKPYLYMQNGRVKKIKVTGIKSGKEKILDVLDTPHPQTVDISFLAEPEDIRITIEDVYHGTKYEDTCINYLSPYSREIIPYEDSVCFSEN